MVLRPKTTINSNISSVDLHVHLRGTLSPKMAHYLSDKNNINLPLKAFGKNNNYIWSDFEDFLNLYDRVGKVVKEADDLYLLTKTYLEKCALSGTIYVEFMLSPDHSCANGITIKGQLNAIDEAIKESNSKFGIDASLIITCVIHRGPEDARELAEKITDLNNPIVKGFGLTGNECKFKISDFKIAFQIARDAGLGLTAHVGEWLDAYSVLEAVQELNLNRVGHGVRAANDPFILKELVAREVGFEICLSSNLALRIFNSPKQHPLGLMIDAGCKISLATDDPAYFNTYPANEYALASQYFNLSDQILKQITKDSISMAFCDNEVKKRISTRIK